MTVNDIVEAIAQMPAKDLPELVRAIEDRLLPPGTGAARQNIPTDKTPAAGQAAWA